MASVTVWKRGGVGALEWDGLVKFLHEKGDADPDFKAFFAVEKGPREGGLHLQGVLDIKTTSAVKISGMLRQALKDPECTDKIRETKVMCKSLTGRHLHTFHGMLGYCQKDIGKPHYKFHLINVEQADLDEGMHQYTLYGAGDIKHKTALEPKTLLSKIEMWYRYKCCSDRNIDVITILRDMLRSGLFYPTMWWIMPTGGAGLSQERLQIMFDIMRDWEATTRSDVRAIFMAPDVRYSDMHMELAEQTSVVNLRDWQKELVDATHAEPHARAVMWWWEPVGNAGKTFLARHLMFHHDAVLVQMMKKEDMLHVLSKSITAKTRIVIFDLVRTTVDDGYDVVYEVMEMLKDRLLCSGKYNSTSMHLKPLHVIAFSNIEPDTTKMSADRWIVNKIPTSADEPIDLTEEHTEAPTDEPTEEPIDEPTEEPIENYPGWSLDVDEAEAAFQTPRRTRRLVSKRGSRQTLGDDDDDDIPNETPEQLEAALGITTASPPSMSP